MLHSPTFINEYNADNREDQQKARRWQISTKIEWNLRKHYILCCFGPFTVEERRKELNRYTVIFTCMSSWAVHIEQLDDMTTHAFMNALRCFTAIGGPIKQLRSSQGSNFAGARNELANSMKELDNDKIQSYLTTNRCKFFMNVPYASHWGGVWEDRFGLQEAF